MEEAHVFALYRWTFKTSKDYEDYDKWSKGSLMPLLMSTDNILGVERCVPLEEKLRFIAFNYYKNLKSYIVDSHSPERDAYRKDIQATWGDKFAWSWLTLYQLIGSFSGTNAGPIDAGYIVDKTTRLKEFTEGDAPIILLRGLGLSTEEWQKYDAWVNEWGNNVYIPLLLKVPGVIAYRRYWLSNVTPPGLPPRPGVSENAEHPQDLSIIYFENRKAYQNFGRSRELTAYDQNLAAAFPGGLNYKWHLACRLVRRWSK